MVINYHKDKGMLKIESATEQELDVISFSLTKQIEGWHFKKKFYNSGWDGKVSFYYNSWIPSGLWKYTYDLCKKYKYECKFNGLKDIFDESIEFVDFENWVNDFFKNSNIKPRDYQIETAFKILKFRKCLAELATSAGKTLIQFLVLAYLIEVKKINKILIIVPNISLVEQFMGDFDEYNYENRINLKFQPIFSGAKIKENSNIIVGTYQSLVKKKKDFYEPVEVISIDEAHKIKTVSIKKILEKCLHCDYKFGLTGTIPKKDTIDFLTLSSHTGPVVSEIKADFLIKKGHISDCEIKIIRLKYNETKVSESFKNLSNRQDFDKARLLKLEQEYTIQYKKRQEFIVNLTLKQSKNTVVFFYRTEHGKILYNELRNKKENKNIYYIDGSTPMSTRELIIEKMKTGENKILVASYGVFSTGISIKNLHRLILAESFKSDIIIRQTIGRGLRQHENKDKLIVFDIVDNLSTSDYKNMLMRHSSERIKIYKEQNFKYEIKNINL